MTEVQAPAGYAAAAGAATRGEERAAHRPRGGLAALSIGALGVVYGDIGTSPLYAVDQIFSGPAQVAPTAGNVLGAISLAIWTITLIVAVKYALLVISAENEGEGGVFALYSLLHPFKHKQRSAFVLLWGLMLGAGLLFGDGMITPAISVLSAVEGLKVATPAFAPYVIPITIALLTGLFAIQFKGASRIGIVFGPVLVVWFVVIAILGLAQIVRQPQILWAFDPWLGLAFLGQAGFREALLILGALMLVVTGGEAMYADLGHFGARPIRVSWFAIVFPALIANYLGQGAYLLGGDAGGQRRPVLQHGAGGGDLSADPARHRRHRHRLAGADLRRLLAVLAGDRHRPDAAHRRPTHRSRPFRPDLHPVRQLGAVSRLRRAGRRFRLVFGACGGLRPRGRRRHAGHLAGDVRRRPQLLAMERGARGPGVGAVHRDQRRFPRRQFAQVPRRRLRAADRRRRGLSRHGDMALGPQGDLRRLCGEVDDDDRAS